MNVRLVSQQAAALAGAFVVPLALGPFLTLTNWPTLIPVIAAVATAAAVAAFFGARAIAIQVARGEAPPQKYIIADCAAAIQQAATEFVRRKANPKLLLQAEANADKQEGRTVAEYIRLVMAEFHASQPVVIAEEHGAVDGKARAAWAISVGIVNLCFFATVNHVWDVSLARDIWIFSVIVLTPLMITAARVIFLDEPAAYQRPLLSRAVRGKDNRHARGRWHKQTRGRELPVFRGLLILCLGGTATLYVLREFAPPAERLLMAKSETELATASAPEPTATPTPEPTPPPTPAIVRRPQPAAPTPPPVATSWRILGDRPSLVSIDAAQLRAANMDFQAIEAAVTEQEPRIRSVFNARHHEIPSLRGRVHVEFQINTSGWVSQSRIVATELNDPEVERSMRDYLDALQFGIAPNRPVTVNYYINFQP